ncbi:S-adenosyl-L-methionine-dependent methyltransferase [Polyplosphaeria fusca]|uniref:sphingolipid C(9)-methyltransferase n=1 Tax=Polyplosphaeria fusca TaxID=682080 RepID=A0A9P4UWX9_9PLEO|nr:S-adenosyl-L-methionine-dependent methyltransferase [Polyplosphaeria fusca]
MSNPIAEETFEFIDTPPAPSPVEPPFDCGVRTTSYPAIANAPLPADGPSALGFNNYLLIAVLLGADFWILRLFGFNLITWSLGQLIVGLPIALILGVFVDLPLLGVFWNVSSRLIGRKNDKAKFPGKPVEHYLTFHKQEDKERYRGKNTIAMETFHEMYFNGDVDFNGDCLEIMEWRHDWANFTFTYGLVKHFLTTFIPELIFHTRSQDEEQVRDHYDRGDDFYAWFLGPRMIYTSGIISDIHREESLEQLQDNKMGIVCEKIALKKGERMLDIGCGWGTLAKFASTNYGADVTGVTLGRNQTAWGNNGLRKAGIDESQSRILCMDYRDIPVPKGGYNKITCLEMAEHVGVRHFGGFCNQVYDMLDDDGVFFLQIAGLRAAWQFEDFTWGLFMNKYVFPGADASTPLWWVTQQLENVGFEIKSVDTVGVHYSATIWRWYRNWIGNKDKVVAKYGNRWFRIWEYFLAYSTIASRQGTATCFQITAVKNINSTHRIEGVPTHFGLKEALEASRVNTRSEGK